MTHQFHGPQDFIMDKRFREWIVNPSKDSNVFWEKFIRENPDKINNIKEAKDFLLNLHDFRYIISEEKAKSIWQHIETKIDDDQVTTEPENLIH